MDDPWSIVGEASREAAHEAAAAAFGRQAVTGIAPLPGGASAASFRLEAGGRAYVLRIEAERVILVAGASGIIGRALLTDLEVHAPGVPLRALVRSEFEEDHFVVHVGVRAQHHDGDGGRFGFERAAKLLAGKARQF